MDEWVGPQIWNNYDMELKHFTNNSNVHVSTIHSIFCYVQSSLMLIRSLTLFWTVAKARRMDKTLGRNNWRLQLQSSRMYSIRCCVLEIQQQWEFAYKLYTYLNNSQIYCFQMFYDPTSFKAINDITFWYKTISKQIQLTIIKLLAYLLQFFPEQVMSK